MKRHEDEDNATLELAQILERHGEFLGNVNITRQELRESITPNSNRASIEKVPEGRYMLMAMFDVQDGRFLGMWLGLATESRRSVEQ